MSELKTRVGAAFTVPPGVDAGCIIDLDHHSPAFNDDEVAVTGELRSRCPIAWNTRYGGFWFATSYSAVSQIGRDYESFAHRFERHASDGVDYYGEQGIPRNDQIPAMGIGEVDGNYHFELRRALNPFFNPDAVAELRPFAEACVDWFIDQKIETGAMDLVLDLTSPVPALLTMKMMGLPYDDWAIWSDVFHTTIAYPVGHPEQVRAASRMPEMLGKLVAFAAERRAHPEDDLTSFLMQLEIEGRYLDDEQVLRILSNLVGGGVDTTTALSSMSLQLLAARPELRRQLIDDPGLYVTATDEFLRYTTVNQMLSRTVTTDIELDGRQLRKNDRVLISWLAANHDGDEFDRPEEIILDRSPNRHVAFGLGPHRCIGSHLARMMFEVIVRGVLARLPDYVIDEDAVETYSGNPAMTGVVKLPARFTPGPVVGAVMPSDANPTR